MRVLITGATGLIGRRVVADRVRRGDAVVALSRDAARAADALGDVVTVVEGNPVVEGPWQSRIDGCDAVVHLAGAGVADRRWTKAYKRVLVNSRVDSTRRVVEAISRAASRPRVLVNASAVGYYGDRGDEPIDETAPPGDDFLAELSIKWERQAGRAADAGIRVVMLRTGVVLDPRGGALGALLPIFRLGLGGPLGSGQQYMPWIAWPDVVGLIDLALADSTLHGPMNVTAPNPVTNRAFTRALGRALHRPAFLPVPPFALRALIGEFGAYATASQRVVPRTAREHGHEFRLGDLDTALDSILAGS